MKSKYLKEIEDNGLTIVKELNSRHEALLARIKSLEIEVLKLKSEPKVVNNYYTTLPSTPTPTWVPQPYWDPNLYKVTSDAA